MHLTMTLFVLSWQNKWQKTGNNTHMQSNCHLSNLPLFHFSLFICCSFNPRWHEQQNKTGLIITWLSTKEWVHVRISRLILKVKYLHSNINHIPFYLFPFLYSVVFVCLSEIIYSLLVHMSFLLILLSMEWKIEFLFKVLSLVPCAITQPLRPTLYYQWTDIAIAADLWCWQERKVWTHTTTIQYSTDYHLHFVHPT